MELKRAIDLVTTLADGVNPITGEILGGRSSFESAAACGTKHTEKHTEQHTKHTEQHTE